MRSSRRRVVVAALTVFALGGCSSSDSGDSRRDGTSDTGGATGADAAGSTSIDACALLSDDDLSRLTGARVRGPGSAMENDMDVPGCRYGDVEEAIVQVRSAPASTWARSLPTALEAFAETPYAEQFADEIETATALVEEGTDIPADLACDLFGAFQAARGSDPETDRTISIIPTAEAPEALSGQMCADGRFTSVVTAWPGLAGSEDELVNVEAALVAAHEASLASSTTR